MTGTDSIEKELKWNAYFIDSVHDAIASEIRRVIEQKQNVDAELTEEEIDEVAEKILDNGIESL